MNRIQERAIILRKIRYSESDLILHCLNEQGSQINLLAKGALRSKKRFGGGILEPTHLLKLTYRKRENSVEDPLHWLEEASLLRDFSGLKQDYDRLEVAFELLQTVGKVSFEGLQDGEEVFQLLGHALMAAEKVKSLNQLRHLFQLKLLWLQGVLPEGLQESPWLRYSLKDVDNMSVSLEDWQMIVAEIHRGTDQLLS